MEFGGSDATQAAAAPPDQWSAGSSVAQAISARSGFAPSEPVAPVAPVAAATPPPPAPPKENRPRSPPRPRAVALFRAPRRESSSSLVLKTLDVICDSDDEHADGKGDMEKIAEESDGGGGSGKDAAVVKDAAGDKDDAPAVPVVPDPGTLRC